MQKLINQRKVSSIDRIQLTLPSFGRVAMRKSGISKEKVKKALQLFQYIHKPKLTIGFIFLFLSSLTSMVFPTLMGKLVDAQTGPVSSDNGWLKLENINTVTIFLMGVFVIQAIFSFFRILIFADVTENMLAKIRQATYEHLIQLPMSFFAQKRVGELNSRISSDTSVIQETFTTAIAEFFRGMITIFLGIGLLAYHSYQLTLIMLGSLPVMVIVAVIFGRHIKKLSKKTQALMADSNVIVEETFTGIFNVKAFTNELYESLRYRKSTDSIKKVAIKRAVWRGILASFIIVAVFGSIVLVLRYGILLVREPNDFSVGDLFTFIIYSVLIGSSFAGIADHYSKILKSIGATEDLMDLFEYETEALSNAKEDTKEKIDGKIELKQVEFYYPSRPDIAVLKGVNLRINPGEKIALVGQSGAGKSTLASLLLRFYTVSKGEILLDGKNANTYNLTNYRSSMAVVPQEILLFGGTIEENIAYGKANATKKEILEAAKKANAHHFISEFKEGYQTLVGERGIQLSGGQRQRIAIARAILRNPSILILDEATSALDTESESLVQEALDQLMIGRTSIIIAHRLSTIKKADRIVVLEKGKIQEMGTHDELLAKENGIYQKLNKLNNQQSVV